MFEPPEKLSGWGRFPVEACAVARPQTCRELLSDLSTASPRGLIARGLGRSYGDSALNRDGHVVEQTGLSRLLAFDGQTGIVDCEAGVSLGELIDAFLPSGWFLSTSPGTKFVTVGGAIAADIHGKNHHAVGSWANFVVDFQLLTASGETLRCSPSEHADVFWATLGGMGLTGVVTTARIQLQRVPSAFCHVSYRRTANLDQTLETFARTDQQYPYSVAWIDCLARGPSLGRSVLMLGRSAAADELTGRHRAEPWRLPRRNDRAFLLDAPGWLLCPTTVRAFNAVYYTRQRDREALVDFDTFFYPLDRVRHWNRVYGRRGFIQYQALFPPVTSRTALTALLERIAASKNASFLAVLKSTGPASGGMLSYPFPGHTLALDLPQTGERLASLVRELDALVLRYGGRLYLAKDATMSAETFAAMYPRLDEFRRVKQRIDPSGRWVSSQARRLRIVEST